MVSSGTITMFVLHIMFAACSVCLQPALCVYSLQCVSAACSAFLQPAVCFCSLQYVSAACSVCLQPAVSACSLQCLSAACSVCSLAQESVPFCSASHTRPVYRTTTHLSHLPTTAHSSTAVPLSSFSCDTVISRNKNHQ